MSRPQPAWLACAFGTKPIFDLGLETDLAVKLYAAGFRMVGALDDLIGCYGEDQLRRLVGRKAYAVVMRALFIYCRRRLLEHLARGNGVAVMGEKKIKYVRDQVIDGRYVRAWKQGRGRNAVIVVQIWCGPAPEGKPVGDWEMPAILGVEAAVAQAILQTDFPS